MFSFTREAGWRLRELIEDERGQDLVEYSLLLGLIVLASATVINSAGGSTNVAWTRAKNALSSAVVAAS